MKKIRLYCVMSIELDSIAAAAFAPDTLTEANVSTKLKSLNLDKAKVMYLDQEECAKVEYAEDKRDTEALEAEEADRVDFGMALKYSGSVTGQYLEYISSNQSRIITAN